MTADIQPDHPQDELDNRLRAASSSQPVVGAALAQSIWIGDAWHDLWLLLAAPLWIAAVVFALRSAFSVESLYLAGVTFLAVGHQLPSFLRVYGQREAAALYRTRLWLAPVVFLPLSLAYALLGYEGLTAMLLLWGLWHALTQTYGVMRIYDSKVYSFASSTIWLDFLMCVGWFGAGVLFSNARMEQLLRVVYACGIPLIEPIFVLILQLIWGGMTFAVTAAFAWNHVVQRRQSERATVLKLLAMLTSFGCWWFAMVNVDDLLTGILLYEVFHAVQSLAIVRVAAVRTSDARGWVSSWVAAIGRRGLAAGLLLVALALLYGLPFYLTEATPFGMVDGAIAAEWQRVFYGLVAASTLVHFYVEGYAWRLREDWVRTSLGVPEIPAAEHRVGSLGTRVPHAAKWALLMGPLALLGWMQWRGGPTVEGIQANLAQVLPQSWRTRAQYGVWLLGQGRVNDAAKELSEALAIRPDSAQTLCDLGRALRGRGQIDEAIAQFQLAVQCDPEMVRAQSELGKTLFAAGRSEEGREHLQRAVSLAPEDAERHYDLGLAQAESGKLEEAMASFNQAITLNGSSAPIYNARGNVYWTLAQHDQAIADFNQAIQLDPQFVKAYRNRAGVWVEKSETPKAIEDCSAAIALGTTSWRDYVMRGDLYYHLGQFDKARSDYVEGVRRADQDLAPAARLVDLLTRCPDAAYRDPQQAIQISRAACQQTRWQDFRWLESLASSHAAAGEPDQAARWQDQAIQLLPAEVPAQAREAMGKQLEQYKQAAGASPPPAAPGISPGPAANEPPDSAGKDNGEPAGK